MDIKAHLKEARESIKNKDYKAAFNICKKILKDDKNNYMALVFLGVSLQEIGPVDKAEAAFRKAISLNENNILAWNGLASFYEKTNHASTKLELIHIYSKLVELENNEGKIIEIVKKLATLKTDKNFLQLVEPIYKITQHAHVSNTIKIQAYKIILINFDFHDVSNGYLTIYKSCFQSLFQVKFEISKDLYSKYLKVLHLLKEYENVSIEAEKMHQMFDLDCVSLEWLCKIFNELYVEDVDVSDVIKSNAEKNINRLMELRPDSAIGILTKAILLYESGDILESMEMINQVHRLKAGVHAWSFYTKCCLGLHFYKEAIQAGLKTEKALNANDFNGRNKIIVYRYLCKCLCKSPEKLDLESAVERCLKILTNSENDVEILCCLIEAYINLENFVEVEMNLSKLKTENELQYILLNAKKLIKQELLDKAATILEAKPCESSEYYSLLAVVYLKQGNVTKCLIPLIRATKLDPNSYLNFYNLGKYYQKVGDIDKSRRCYEKCFNINRNCAEAGIELSNIYRKLNKWDDNLDLLLNLTKGRTPLTIKWAFIQLGMHYLGKKDYQNAIDKLRMIVRVDPTNLHCWESLADAYLGRGAYISALRSYEEALELKPNSLYPMLQIANIKKILGEFVEARDEFEKILSLNKIYLPALKGIAETCFYQAQQYYRQELHGRSRESLQYAVEKLVIAIRERNTLSCLWKIVADCCYLATKFPTKFKCLSLETTFVEGEEKAGNTLLIENDLFDFAEKCYCKAASLVEDNSSLYYDLTNCFLSHAKQTTDDEKVSLLKKALTITYHSLNNDPSNWQFWNILGNIAFEQEPKQLALAQHSFIKAVSIERKSAVAWSNLGTIYFYVGDVKLANDAFSQAQRGNPSYVNSWIGQALIAELTHHEDSMDLFRHSTQLASHPQGALGYGYWVCKTLMDNPPHKKLYSIDNMYAIPIACDALTWYTERNPFDACAWNMLGFLRERLGLKQSTLEAYNNARKYASNEHLDAVLVNCGRILRRLGNYSESIKVYKSIRDATFNSGSGLALALFKDEQYEESYESYEGALHWLTDKQTHQSDILVALASMMYMFEGPDAAKTLLFQSVNGKSRSPWSLYATLSLGLLHQDVNLAELVIQEMHEFKDNPECISNYANLLVYFYLSQGENTKALKELSKLVHRHPSQGSLWLSLSVLLLRLHNEKPVTSAAANCAKTAMKLGQFNMDVTKVLCIVSLSCLLAGNYKEALKAAQSAIHYYPELPESWSLLVCAMKSCKQEREYNTDLYKDFVTKHLNIDTSLKEWLNIF